MLVLSISVRGGYIEFAPKCPLSYDYTNKDNLYQQAEHPLVSGFHPFYSIIVLHLSLSASIPPSQYYSPHIYDTFLQKYGTLNQSKLHTVLLPLLCARLHVTMIVKMYPVPPLQEIHNVHDVCIDTVVLQSKSILYY